MTYLPHTHRCSEEMEMEETTKHMPLRKKIANDVYNFLLSSCLLPLENLLLNHNV